MKTITRNGSNVSLYLFSDETLIDVQPDKTIIGDPEQLIILDCNVTNITVHEQVSEPEAWRAWKYFYDGQAWTLNPEWIDPDGSASL